MTSPKAPPERNAMLKSMKLTRGILATILAMACGRAGLAQISTVPLSSAQATCNEGQLGRLLDRTTTIGKLEDNVSFYALTTLVSYSNSVGFYDGLALTNEGVRCSNGLPPLGAPEFYLAFNVNPSIRGLLLNPRRPPLGQVELSREETGSNLVKPSDENRISLTISPTLASSSDSGLLTINNFVVPAIGSPYNGFLASSTKPGRGLSEDALLTPCHTAFTAQDRKIFAILQRMVRVAARPGNCFLDTKVAIFRGEDPHRYRVDAYVLGLDGAPLGKAAALLEIEWTGTGTLTSGTLSMLPACSGSRAGGNSSKSASALGTFSSVSWGMTGFDAPVA